MPGSTPTLLLIIAVLAAGTAAADTPAGDQYQRGTMIDLLLASRALEIYDRAAPPTEEGGDTWEPVVDLFLRLDPGPLSRAPATDRWGNPILFRRAWGGWLLLSRGPDGAIDHPEAMEEIVSDTHWTAPSRFAGLGGDDIVVHDDQVVHGPRTTEDRWRRTMSDLRTLATAAAAYAIDNDRYPVVGPDPLAAGELDALLSPAYIRAVPELDAWGRPFLARTTDEHCLLVSFGSDGEPDLDYAALDLADPSWADPSFTDPSRDIVHLDGVFVSYPDQALVR